MWNRNSNGVSTTYNNKVSFYLAPVAALPGGHRPCSAPTRINLPGDGDEVNTIGRESMYFMLQVSQM